MRCHRWCHMRVPCPIVDRCLGISRIFDDFGKSWSGGSIGTLVDQYRLECRIAKCKHLSGFEHRMAVSPKISCETTLDLTLNSMT